MILIIIMIICLIQLETFWRAGFFCKPLYPGYMLEEGSKFFPVSTPFHQKTSAGSSWSSLSFGVQFSPNRRHGWIRKTWQAAVFCWLGKGQKFKLGIWFRLVWAGSKTNRSQQLLGNWNSSDAFNLVLTQTWCIGKLADWLKRSVSTSPQKVSHSLAMFRISMYGVVWIFPNVSRTLAKN